MRIAIILPLLALCSACAVVPDPAWTYDPRTPPAKVALPPQELVPLTERLAQLQIERNQIRDRIAGERDVWVRQEHYRQLHAVGMELSPLQRRLSGVELAR